MSTSETITESALRLFYRQGYHASGVEQLSQEAGVTKKTLYRHFASKELLVEAALRLRHSQFMQKMQQSVQAALVQDRPMAYVDFIAAWTVEEGFYGCAFINAVAEYSAPAHPPHVLAKQHKQEVLAFLESLCGDAKLAQPSLIAQQLFLIGEGVIVTQQVHGAAAECIDAARNMALTLIASLQPVS